MNEFEITKCRNIPEIDCLKIPMERLEEGIKLMQIKKYKGLFLVSPGNAEPQVINFDFLKKIPFIKSFQLSVPLKNGSNINGIHSIANLIDLSYFNYDSYPLDNTKLKSLEYLYTHFSENLVTGETSNLAQFTRLKKLKIWHVNSEDCTFLSKSSPILEKLEIAHGNIKSLSGVGKLNYLNELNIYGLTKLISISDIAANKTIESLKIEACNKIQDISSLGKSISLKNLYIQNVKSLDFVEQMKKLENLGFSDCEYGNFNPLLKAPKLKSVGFPRDKKHYSLKLKELNEILIKKNG